MEETAAISGILFDGETPAGREVLFLPDRGELQFADGGAVLPLASVRLSPSFGTPTRRVDLDDGRYCELANDPRLDALTGPRGAFERLLARLENAWLAVLLALACLAVSALYAYLNLLPNLAHELALRTPESWQRSIGRSALAQLDLIQLAPSELPRRIRLPLEAKIRTYLASQSAIRPPLRVHFRSTPSLGANAFALPSGDIVVTDALVREVGRPDEIVAIIAHEAGHVGLRHGLQGLIKGSALALGTSLAFGDFSNTGLIAAAVLDARYSRAQETEADRYAFQSLRSQRMDPCLLGRALARLDANARDGRRRRSWLDSHPATLDRIAAACPNGTWPRDDEEE